RRVDADLLVRFAERRLDERLTGIGRPARKADLAGVPLQPAGAHGQRDRRAPLAGIDEDEPGGETRVAWKLSWFPARARRRRRHEPQLCLESRQRAGETLAERCLQGGEIRVHRRLRTGALRAGFAAAGCVIARSPRSPTLRP